MARKGQRQWYGPPCLVNGEHGGMLDFRDSKTGALIWWCPHIDHYRRPSGSGAFTPDCFFTDKQAWESQYRQDGVA